MSSVRRLRHGLLQFKHPSAGLANILSALPISSSIPSIHVESNRTFLLAVDGSAASSSAFSYLVYNVAKARGVLYKNASTRLLAPERVFRVTLSLSSVLIPQPSDKVLLVYASDIVSHTTILDKYVAKLKELSVRRAIVVLSPLDTLLSMF